MKHLPYLKRLQNKSVPHRGVHTYLKKIWHIFSCGLTIVVAKKLNLWGYDPTVLVLLSDAGQTVPFQHHVDWVPKEINFTCSQGDLFKIWTPFLAYYQPQTTTSTRLPTKVQIPRQKDTEQTTSERKPQEFNWKEQTTKQTKITIVNTNISIMFKHTTVTVYPFYIFSIYKFELRPIHVLAGSPFSEWADSLIF